MRKITTALFMLLFVVVFGYVFPEEDFSLEETNGQEECESVVVKRRHRRCVDRRKPYKRSYIPTENEEVLPSWPGKIENPLYEELSR